MRTLVVLLLSALTSAAQAKCLYAPHAQSTIDVYMFLTDYLRARPILHTLSFMSNEVHECTMTVATPNPDRSLRITLNEMENGKVLKTATLEVPGSTVSHTQAQCLWTKDLDPQMGPVAELEVKGQNGQFNAHLTLDEPGAPYINATIQDQKFTCTAQ